MTITADRLREALDDVPMSQAELARRIGVSQGSISAILAGNTRQSKHLPQIALELDVSYDWLIGDSPDKHRYSFVDERVLPDERDLLIRRRDLPLLDRVAFDRLAEALFAAQDMTRDIAKYLPDERALTAMFEGMLDQVPDDMDQTGRARLLARWLPTSLSQLRDLRSDTQASADAETASAEAQAIHDRESQS